MKPRLYSVALSHPSRAARLMLRCKGIDFELVNVPPGSQPIALRLRGFRRGTVPALDLDGRRVQGSLEISRVLEELRPEPPLFPADPELRSRVQEAERWGEGAYQPVPRRLFRWSLTRDRALREYLGASSGMPAPAVMSRLMLPVSLYFARVSGANGETTRADLAAIPGHIDQIDRLLAEGVVGGEALNAADFQIATTTRVLLNFPQIRPLIEGRPAGEHAMRVIPDFGREIPVKLPEEWVPSPS